MQQLRVMLYRKDANIDYKLAASKGIHSILIALRRTYDVKEIWVTLEGGAESHEYQENIETYNIYSFRNGREIIENLKPDLIVLSGDYEYLTRSILRAGTAFKIPVVVLISAFAFWVEEEAPINKMISGRFHILRARGKSIVRRYLYLLRTLIRCGYSFSFIVKTIIRDVYVPFVSYEPTYKFGGGDLNLVSSHEWVPTLQRYGIDKNKIAVVGDWNMDLVYEKLAKLDRLQCAPNTQTILFVTTAKVEHGYWSPKMRETVVSTIVKALGELPNTILKVKIHPATEKLQDYEEIIKPINPNVEIIQKRELLPLVNEADVIVTFGESWGLLDVLLLNKPILVVNLFNEDMSKNPYVKAGVAIECKNADELIQHIVNNTFKPDPHKIAEFIENKVYKFDGKCGERAAMQIISLIKKAVKENA